MATTRSVHEACTVARWGEGNSQIMAINLMISTRTVVTFSSLRRSLLAFWCAYARERRNGTEPTCQRRIRAKHVVPLLYPLNWPSCWHKKKSTVRIERWGLGAKRRRRGNALFRASRLELNILRFHPPPSKFEPNFHTMWKERRWIANPTISLDAYPSPYPFMRTRFECWFSRKIAWIYR